jgi:hypothetical protein
MGISEIGKVLYHGPAELAGGLISEDKGAVMLTVIEGCKQV